MTSFRRTMAMAALFLCGSISKAYPQIKARHIIIEGVGFYQKGQNLPYLFTPTPPPATGYFSPENDNQKAWKLLGSVGYMVTDHWLISIGIHRLSSTVLNAFISGGETSTIRFESNGRRDFQYTSTRPYLEVKYFFKLADRFWVAPTVTLAYGKQTYSYGEFVNLHEYSLNDPTAPPMSSATGMSTTYTSQVIQTMVSPVLGYRITSWLGAKLTPGGLTVTKDNTASERYRTTQLAINFNPSTWTLGLYSSVRFK